MRTLTLSKLGLTLIIVFSLLLLALVAEILYLIWRRRQLLRVEPTGAAMHASEPPAVKQLVEIQGTSRVLFTIKEEDREELETHGELPFVKVVDIESEPPFLTPCASPPYYTPTSSPGRERIMAAGGMVMG